MSKTHTLLLVPYVKMGMHWLLLSPDASHRAHENAQKDAKWVKTQCADLRVCDVSIVRIGVFFFMMMIIIFVTSFLWSFYFCGPRKVVYSKAALWSAYSTKAQTVKRKQANIEENQSWNQDPVTFITQWNLTWVRKIKTKVCFLTFQSLSSQR